MLVTMGCVDAELDVRETNRVPRQPPRPQFGPDDWTAIRVRFEREHRGWSTAELARRITMAGFPMRQQQVWQIESGSPRRKVSIGEAIAIAGVFGIPVTELTRPPDGAISKNLSSLGARFAQWRREAGDLAVRLADIAREVDAVPHMAWPADVPPSAAAQDACRQLEEIETAVEQVRRAIAAVDERWEYVVSLRDIPGQDPSLFQQLSDRERQLDRSWDRAHRLYAALVSAWDSPEQSLPSAELAEALKLAYALFTGLGTGGADKGGDDGAR